MSKVWFNFKIHLYIVTSPLGVKGNVIDVKKVIQADTCQLRENLN